MVADGSGGFLLQRNWRNSSANSTAPPLPRSTRQPQKNVPCFFVFSRGWIFLKWKGHFSFWGSAFQVFWQGGGASIRTSAKRKIYFSGGKDFSALPQTVFVFSPRGGGVWGGIRAGFFWAGELGFPILMNTFMI